MDYHNAEKPDAVLSDLEAKHGSSPTAGSASKCDNWTKCPHAKCLRETMSGESWACEVCKESWTLDYDEIR